MSLILTEDNAKALVEIVFGAKIKFSGHFPDIGFYKWYYKETDSAVCVSEFGYGKFICFSFVEKHFKEDIIPTIHLKPLNGSKNIFEALDIELFVKGLINLKKKVDSKEN